MDQISRLTAINGEAALTANIWDAPLGIHGHRAAGIVSEAKCHLIPIGFLPPDPDQSAVSWMEKPSSSEVAMSQKMTGKPVVGERSSPPSAAVDPSTR
jgi:hypothetical protein